MEDSQNTFQGFLMPQPQVGEGHHFIGQTNTLS